jgi:hypothetical protein
VAYSAPSTRSAGYVVSATNWNAELVDNMLWLGRDAPHCRVYNNAAISHTTTGAWQAVTLNSERHDTGAMHSTVSNTSRITVPTGGGGVYAVGGCVDFANNGTGVRAIGIRLNGTTFLAVHTSPTRTDGGQPTLSIATEYLLAAGDYVELMAWQNSGGALNLTSSANFAPEFHASWRYAS